MAFHNQYVQMIVLQKSYDLSEFRFYKQTTSSNYVL